MRNTCWRTCAIISAYLIVFQFFFMGLPICAQTTPITPVVIPAHTDGVTALKFSPSGGYLASADCGGRLFVSNTRTWGVVECYQLPFGGIEHIEWSANSEKFLCWSDGEGASIIDRLNNKQMVVYSDSEGLLRSSHRHIDTMFLKLSADGNFLLRGSSIAPEHAHERQLDPDCKFVPLEVIELTTSASNSFWAVHPNDGAMLNGVLLKDDSFIAMDGRGSFTTGQLGQSRVSQHVRNNHEELVDSLIFGPLAVSSTGNRIVVSGRPGIAELWKTGPLEKVRNLIVDVNTKELSKTKSLPNIVPHESLAVVNALAISDDGIHVTASTLGGIVQMWDQDGQRMVNTFSLERALWKMAYSPRHSSLVAGWSTQQKLFIIRSNQGVLLTLDGVSSYDWSPDGLLIAVGGAANGDIRILNIPSLQDQKSADIELND